jgi:glycerate-2-kinase
VDHDGLVVLKKGEQNELGLILAVYASHPIPDGGSLAAGGSAADLARRAGENDLVISAFTRRSLLAILPADGISLETSRC